MTNTYPNNADNMTKISEELRLIRCILERKLNSENPQLFVDYEMEKFGRNYRTTKNWDEERVVGREERIEEIISEWSTICPYCHKENKAMELKGVRTEIKQKCEHLYVFNAKNGIFTFRSKEWNH